MRADRDAARALTSGLFASTAGGDVQVQATDSSLLPERSVYRVRLVADEPPVTLRGHRWRGRVTIAGDWSSVGWRYARAAIAKAVREASF